MSDAETVAEAVAPETTEASNEPAWSYAEGVGGEGDAPEWFKSDKYKSVSAQAEAYTNLEKQFGSFTGAPEEYEAVLSDELKEMGVELASDDPLMTQAMEFAKKTNMNQEGFAEMVSLYAMGQVAESKAIEDFKAQEIASLGDNAQKRLDNLSAWGKANLSADIYEGFEGLAQDAQSVQALERLVAMTRNAPVSSEHTQQAPSTSAEEVRKMQFEKDEHGNRRIQTDPDFRARYNKLRDQAFGTEDHRITVG